MQFCPASRCSVSIRYAKRAVTGFAPTPPLLLAAKAAAPAAATSCANVPRRSAAASAAPSFAHRSPAAPVPDPAKRQRGPSNHSLSELFSQPQICSTLQVRGTFGL